MFQQQLQKNKLSESERCMNFRVFLNYIAVIGFFLFDVCVQQFCNEVFKPVHIKMIYKKRENMLFSIDFYGLFIL